LSQKKVLRLFYPRDLFMSPKAKAEFVEPDLTTFPRSSQSCELDPESGGVN